MTLPSQSRQIIIMSALLLIAACGGGGGGGGGTITPPPPPPPPPPVRVPQTAYFIATDPNTTQRHVFSESDDGGALHQLTPNFAGSASHVRGTSLSPDRQTLAYSANADDASVVDLYVMPAAGGTPTKVSSGLPANTGVLEMAWSPDSSSIAYTANPAGRAPRGFTIYEVFLADRDGGNNRKINGSIGSPPSVAVNNIKWSPDGTRVSYRADLETDNIFELYVTGADGTGNVKVNGPLVTGGQTSAHYWSPDSRYVAYIATQNDTGVRELFVSRADGMTNNQVNSPLVMDANIRSFGVTWSDDSTRIAFMDEIDDIFTDVLDLYVGTIDGAAPIRLNDTNDFDGIYVY